MHSAHRAFFNASDLPHAYIVDELGVPLPKRKVPDNTTHLHAAIYHYLTKSAEDYEEKIERGGGDGVTR